MKYRDENGVFQDLYLPPTGDTLPIGSEVDYDGTEVPYGWEETTDPESYSTDEVKTNKTWINGKPVYRRVVKLTSSNYNASSSSYDISSWNIDSIVKQDSLLNYKDGSNREVSRGSFYTDSSDYVFYFIRSNIIEMRMGSAQTGGTFNYWQHIIEYTKTTD